MKKIVSLALLTLLAFTTSCKKEANEEVKPTVETEKVEVAEEVVKIKFTLSPKSGSTAKGNVVFKQENGKVEMIAMLEGLSAGEHAIHIHQTADCSSEDGKSSGGHWNPTGQPHGKWGKKEGYHRGDIGNFVADEKGYAVITKITDEWCIGCEDETKNILGKAIIVHQGVDDYTSQPSGAAGSRISCGGIIQ